MRLFTVSLLISLLFGCTESHFPVNEGNQEKVTKEIGAKVVPLTNANIKSFYRTRRDYTETRLPVLDDWNYLIGVGDIVSVAVFDHPELALPARNGLEFATGFRIQADGSFYYPYIGQVRALDRTVNQLRSEISQRLKAFLNDPQVDVRISEFNSQGIIVSGEVKAPRRQKLSTVPLTLLESLNASGGWTAGADIARITVRRNDRLYRVDLRGFLEGNLKKNNPVLVSGDVIHVPTIENLEAFVMGEISNTKSVNLSTQLVSLTDAVIEAGGPRQVRSDARGVFVFRQVGDQMNVFQLNTQSPAGWLLGTKFTLQPQDIVFVTTAPLQVWNDTINKILPYISAVNTLDDLQRRYGLGL
ncbi:polysaccharide biosynthesis/export family protein [Pseudopelagicola sp. nBUS_20]|uniref:polysaccharide biosynthesis/export family protein n=1 Tax=Pseudopelagicola sp. nBUS_20 TaxID=3395317 RepID=UPI003EBD0D9F